MPSEAVVFLTALSIIGGCILLYPLIRALAERIRGRADTGVRDELHGFREDVVQDAQQTDRAIAELSERVDFLERFIAKQREAERLPPVR
jgi:hypothetical protein